jgi:hypothetical protein
MFLEGFLVKISDLKKVFVLEVYGRFSDKEKNHSTDEIVSKFKKVKH